jgi:hypothetical protein
MSKPKCMHTKLSLCIYATVTTFSTVTQPLHSLNLGVYKLVSPPSFIDSSISTHTHTNLCIYVFLCQRFCFIFVLFVVSIAVSLPRLNSVDEPLALCDFTYPSPIRLYKHIACFVYLVPYSSRRQYRAFAGMNTVNLIQYPVQSPMIIGDCNPELPLRSSSDMSTWNPPS